MPTAGDLRQALTHAQAKWTIDTRLADGDQVKRYPLGGDLSRAEKVETITRIDVATELAKFTANPFLRQQRANRGIKPAMLVRPDVLAHSAVPAGQTPGGAPESVDWRNRFGWPWLTTTKDQQSCESCWCFSATGVVEAMTRIEHGVWSLRSEGDVHDGMGAKCSDGGWPNHALDWMQGNGAADPGCWPYETTNENYRPTADRDGRTVKIASYVTLSNVEDQKTWLDTVGPIAGCFTCYDDFFGYGPTSGVYTKTSNTVAGGHCIVVVGYDDSKQAWLIRNSWGSGWGMDGYCWFGYGQCDMDANAKYGVNGNAINSDPWTKRRVHNGNIVESGDGTLHRNFEVWAAGPGNCVRHYWRDGTSLAWALAESVGNDCADSPTATATTYNRNFEYVFRTTGNRLHHRFFDQATGTWLDGGVFGPENVGGAPAFIQSDYGAPGNFEIVVQLQDGMLQHWWRMDGPPWTWSAGPIFGSDVKFSGRSLIQRRDRGLDVVCTNTNGVMQRYWRDDINGMVWKAGETFGSGVASSPVMIEGEFGAADETKIGNYELCVAVGGSIQHWWRNNQNDGGWANSATFGTNVAQVLGLIESSFGFDLEVVALLNDDSLQHYWRQSDGWHAGPIFGSTNR